MIANGVTGWWKATIAKRLRRAARRSAVGEEVHLAVVEQVAVAGLGVAGVKADDRQALADVALGRQRVVALRQARERGGLEAVAVVAAVVVQTVVVAARDEDRPAGALEDRQRGADLVDAAAVGQVAVGDDEVDLRAADLADGVAEHPRRVVLRGEARRDRGVADRLERARAVLADMEVVEHGDPCDPRPGRRHERREAPRVGHVDRLRATAADQLVVVGVARLQPVDAGDVDLLALLDGRGLRPDADGGVARRGGRPPERGARVADGDELGAEAGESEVGPQAVALRERAQRRRHRECRERPRPRRDQLAAIQPPCRHGWIVRVHVGCRCDYLVNANT